MKTTLLVLALAVMASAGMAEAAVETAPHRSTEHDPADCAAKPAVQELRCDAAEYLRVVADLIEPDG